MWACRGLFGIETIIETRACTNNGAADTSRPSVYDCRRVNEGITETQRRFAAVVGHRSDELDLALAALLIAQAEYPGLDPQEHIGRLDHLAVEVDENVDLRDDADAACEKITVYLSQRLGFRGDDENYYDARNSYLNDVLDRRRGSAAALCVLYIEVARRLGIELRPVAFPGHFLLRLRSPGHALLFVDPYNNGRLLDLDGCRQLLADLHGESRPFSDSLVAPGTLRQVIARLLQDLRFVYLQENSLDKAVRTLELLTALTPWDVELIRDRGLLYARAGHKDAAIDDLTAYLHHARPGSSLQPVKDMLRRLTRHAAKLPEATAYEAQDIDPADDH